QFLLALTSAAELFFNVHFQVRLGDNVERDRNSSARAVVENYVVVFDAYYLAAKVALTVYGLARSYFRKASNEPLIVAALIKTSLQTGRRNFKRVGRVYEILHVQDSAQLVAHLRAIFVGDAYGLVNEDANYGMPVRPC